MASYCSGVGEQGEQPALVEGVVAGPDLADGAAQRVEQALRIGVDAGQGRFDQGQEVVPHPGHAR